MRNAHPLLERPEEMLDRAFADSHHVRSIAQSNLHLLQYRFLRPAPSTPSLTRCALRFQGAALTL